MNLNSREDQVFLNRLTVIVEANLEDENFGVSKLAENAGMSRSRLHLRVKSITQKSVSQFIREIRLNRAKELLINSELNVSEISYRVGFGSPTYFNKCFHEQFGYPPGDAKNHVLTNAESESDERSNQTNSTDNKARKKIPN